VPLTSAYYLDDKNSSNPPLTYSEGVFSQPALFASPATFVSSSNYSKLLADFSKKNQSETVLIEDFSCFKNWNNPSVLFSPLIHSSIPSPSTSLNIILNLPPFIKKIKIPPIPPIPDSWMENSQLFTSKPSKTDINKDLINPSSSFSANPLFYSIPSYPSAASYFRALIISLLPLSSSHFSLFLTTLAKISRSQFEKLNIDLSNYDLGLLFYFFFYFVYMF
jgi:hypothetical protein